MHCDDNTELKKKLLKRLRRIEGQLRGLQRLVEEDAYCIDIITQSTAARRALVAFETELLKNHITTCVVSLVKGGKVKKAADEIAAIYEASHKK